MVSSKVTGLPVRHNIPQVPSFPATGFPYELSILFCMKLNFRRLRNGLIAR